MVARTDAVLSGAVWKVGHEGNSAFFHDQAKADEGTLMLCVRDSEAILRLERASLSRVLCQTMTMQRAMELKSECQRENVPFSFWCGVNESVLGSWDCHV